jgi:hypothetical protein
LVKTFDSLDEKQMLTSLNSSVDLFAASQSSSTTTASTVKDIVGIIVRAGATVWKANRALKKEASGNPTHVLPLIDQLWLQKHRLV